MVATVNTTKYTIENDLTKKKKTRKKPRKKTRKNIHTILIDLLTVTLTLTLTFTIAELRNGWTFGMARAWYRESRPIDHAAV